MSRSVKTCVLSMCLFVIILFGLHGSPESDTVIVELDASAFSVTDVTDTAAPTLGWCGATNTYIVAGKPVSEINIIRTFAANGYIVSPISLDKENCSTLNIATKESELTADSVCNLLLNKDVHLSSFDSTCIPVYCISNSTLGTTGFNTLFATENKQRNHLQQISDTENTFADTDKRTSLRPPVLGIIPTEQRESIIERSAAIFAADSSDYIAQIDFSEIYKSDAFRATNNNPIVVVSDVLHLAVSHLTGDYQTAAVYVIGNTTFVSEGLLSVLANEADHYYMTETAVVRSGPGAQYSVIGTQKVFSDKSTNKKYVYDTLPCYGFTDDGVWAITVFDNQIGYIDATSLSANKPAFSPVLWFAVKSSTVYVAPDTTSKTLGVLRFNQPISYVGSDDNGWSKILYGNTIGYVHSSDIAEHAAKSFGFTTEGDVPLSRQQYANKYMEEIPSNVWDAFAVDGWELRITTKDVNLNYYLGVYGGIAAVTSYDKELIVVGYSEVRIRRALMHEIGHYIDYKNRYGGSRFISTAPSSGFQSIFAAEQSSIIFYEMVDRHPYSSAVEYFAESVSAAVRHPDTTKSSAPRTYAFVMKCIRNISPGGPPITIA